MQAPKEERALERTVRNVNRLIEIARRPGPMLVLMQDNPDPDALGSAAAIRDLVYARIKKHVAIGYGGVCGRAENRIMMDLLQIHAEHVTADDVGRFRTVCMVDAQPQAENVLHAAAQPHIVIDHHLLPRKPAWTAEMVDVRPDYGATSSILYEYLLVSEVIPSPALATAMFYGIQSDTQDLGRESGPADIAAYRDLFLLADKKKLARIRRAPVPALYFRMLADSIERCEIAGATALSRLEDCQNPDMISEVADLFIRLQGMHYAVCYGAYNGKIYISARANEKGGNAAKALLQAVEGIGSSGGHRRMAGALAPITGSEEKALDAVRKRILKVFAPGQRVIPLTEFQEMDETCPPHL